MTGARLLGRDIAEVASEKVKNILLGILESDKLKLLANEMAQYESLPFERDEKIKKCLELLNNMLIGLTDKH
jgi:predicted nucleotidyltransferase